MKLQFLGAAQTVTGSQYLLTTDRARVLVDCGMFQGPPEESRRNQAGFAYEPKGLDAVLLTHAHLDHCGMLPALVKDGYGGPIHATRGTIELARLVLLDSGKLQVEQAKAHAERAARLARRAARKAEQAEQAAQGSGPGSGAGSSGSAAGASGAQGIQAQEPQGVGGQHGPHAAAAAAGGHDHHWDTAGFPRGGDDPEFPPYDPQSILKPQPPEQPQRFEPLYDEADAARALEHFQGLDYEQPIDVAPGVKATFHDAGHILGSAIIVLDVTEGDRTQRLVFSGDLGRSNAPILRDPTSILGGADHVLCESTYGGREHEPEQEAIEILAQAVRATADHSGVLLVPSFAIGRTQDLLWYLDRLLSAGRIPHLPLYVDSPMASKATAAYKEFPAYFDETTHQLLTGGDSPLAYPGMEFTDSVEQSKAIAHKPRPMMILSASGMLTGGRIVHHLSDLIDDPKAMLLFVGYQGEGTLGARLQSGAQQIELFGRQRTVRCEVRSVSGFSAHADEDELVAWLQHFATAERKPKQVFCVHGDPEAQAALATRVTGLGLTPYRATWREEVVLE
ncbi:MAG TPA: MBL fold metallo-hydrolase [Candidatus Limnocylindrales bacterium]|nr:MBL fold metallo-hydrolase [Candidatus Limnocylindrales bacterium]